jgi:predicted small metal-binding protein
VAKVIECPCGFVVRADDDDQLVERAQQHANEAHGLALTREEALAMAHPTGPGRGTPGTTA